MSFINLVGRTSIVTGAAGGIGAAICAELAQAGSTIALFDIDQTIASALAKRIADETGVVTRVYAVDVRNADSVNRAVAQVVADCGAVDHLINAHGIQFLSRFESFPDDKWDLIYDINLKGVYRTTRAVWPYLVKRGRGRIINIASVHGLIASELKSAYVTAKHGVV